MGRHGSLQRNHLRPRADTPTHFTKTIQFRDINYQLSDNEDKQAIFDGWCDFLNYFDSSIKFQFSFVNLTALRESFARAIPLRSDQFESIQRELSKIIEVQQAKGNNGMPIWRTYSRAMNGCGTRYGIFSRPSQSSSDPSYPCGKRLDSV